MEDDNQFAFATLPGIARRDSNLARVWLPFYYKRTRQGQSSQTVRTSAAARRMTDAAETVETAPGGSASSGVWSREHHLIGQTTTTLAFLRADENVPDYYHPTEESVAITAFQPERPALRQPALWRSLIPSGGGAASLAVDYVAADTQDGTIKSLLQPANVARLQTRIEAAVWERVASEILPTLVLVAALEEVRSQFVKATANRSNKLTTTTTTSTTRGSSRSATSSSPPPYYTTHPNQYMKAPEAPSTDDANDEGPAPPSASFSFTPSQLANRIKAGCTLAYQRIQATQPVTAEAYALSEQRRASSRLARMAEEQKYEPLADEDEVYRYWKVTSGGNVATYIMEHWNGKDKGEVTMDTDESHVEEEEDEDENPFLQATDEAVLDWLGRKTAKLLSSSDLQNIFPSLVYRAEKKGKKKKTNAATTGLDALPLMSPLDQTVWRDAMDHPTDISETARLCLQSVAYEDVSEMEDWETAYFGRSTFALRLVDDMEEPATVAAVTTDPSDETDLIQFKEDKAWNLWRFKGIQGGYTVWPSWKKAVEDWRMSTVSQSTLQPSETVPAPTTGESEETDRDLAQAIAAQEDDTPATTGRRTTRRGGDSSAVFYGNQSTMTLKQLMDALLRIVSTRPSATILDLLAAVQDDSTDPVRRMRSSMGRIIWKRNQLTRLDVTTSWTDSPCLKHLSVKQDANMLTNGDANHSSEIFAKLPSYMRELLVIELRLRRLVIKHLNHLPLEVIATAADERKGTIESIDDVDFEAPDELDWLSEGHALLGKYIYRPFETSPVDYPGSCYWYRVESYVPSVEAPVEVGSVLDSPPIGNAKETKSVERRLRFKVVPEQPRGRESTQAAPQPSALILTEGQVRASLKAAVMKENKASDNTQNENPMRGRTGAKISLVPVEGQGTQKTGVVAGHNSILSTDGELQHRMLVLIASESGESSSLWVVLEGRPNGLHCRIDGEDETLYSVQEFDYDSSSTAFKECKSLIAQLQRNSKAIPFLEPVDPIALQIPQYFQVVKQPMDLSTLNKKLENGEYSRFALSETIGNTPVARMLNGPFRVDLELIFHNATLFNPPDDWIHQAAISMKKFAVKKIEQACQNVEEIALSRRRIKSVYVEYDSDTDMYGYDDAKDEDYDGSSRKRRRAPRASTKEDPSIKAIERPTPLQKVMPDGNNLRGPMGNLPVISDASSFALSTQWKCKTERPAPSSTNQTTAVAVSIEIDELIELRSHLEDQASSDRRRSTRAATIEPESGSEQKKLENIAYTCDLLRFTDLPPPTNRTEVEIVRERMHEDYFAKTFRDVGKGELQEFFGSDEEDNMFGVGKFANDSFPPYLGSIIPSSDEGGLWEIRAPCIVPALRWVIRGLVASEHLGTIDPLDDDNQRSGVVLANNVYYFDDTLTPYDVVDQKEFSRRKKAKQGDSANNEEEDDAIELSEYEKLRAERVARNADRLKALGLA